MAIGTPKSRWIEWISIPRLIVAVLLIGLVGWGAFSTQQVHELQKQRILFNERIKLIQVQQDLLVPSEVIYYDRDVATMAALAEVRLKSYASLGLDSYLPYSHLRYTSGNLSEIPTSSKLNTHMNAGLEDWWIKTVPSVCGNLAQDIEREIGLGLYLKQNPELFDVYLRPLLVRLLDSYNYRFRTGACHVLLAMGDRSEELMEIFQLTAVNEYNYKDDTNRIIKRYGLDMKVSEEETTYEERVAAWKRTHEIVNELKKKYPLTSSTVIRYWDRFCFERE